MTTPVSRLSDALAERYAIEREIGTGGMATVYLARDLRHHRLVALKLLRPELGAVIGAERFLAEIRTTANLQHPHILPLFDSGEADGLLFYVMPYVEGVSLRTRLEREKQLPVPEAIRIAGEVASALDYAHRHGVIHRDIKPENILLHDGRALVADFGIALAVSSAGSTRMTETGMSLGTPHYMSPEQAMGERDIDARSDVYALGAVTYEMLVGEPPFTGPTAQAIVARVVTEEPRPMLPRRHTIPQHVEAAVLTALEKLPADRFATAADFAEAMRSPAFTGGRRATATPAVAMRGSQRRAWGVASAGAALLLAVAFAAGWFSASSRSRSAPVARFIVRTAHEHTIFSGGPSPIAISPDGSTIVYAAQGPSGVQLYRRRIDELDATPIPGTEGGIGPYFTPDGQWIGFGTITALKKVPVSGGSPVTLLTGTSSIQAAMWLDNETMLITDGAQLQRLEADGSKRLVAMADTARGEGSLIVADVLPDGEHVLVIANPAAAATGRVFAVSVRTGKRRLVSNEVVAAVAYDAGHIVWVRPDGALMGARFDARSMRIEGAPVTLAPRVRGSVGGLPHFALSRGGVLAYVPEQPFHLVFVDRAGNSTPAIDVQRRFHSPRISPDGRRIAVDFTQQGTRDVWVLDLRQRTMSRATFEDDGHDPVWTTDGQRIAFATARKSRAGIVGIMRRAADGSGAAESLFVSGASNTVGAFIPGSGDAIVIYASSNGNFDLMRLPAAGGPLEPVLTSSYNENYPAISPDGRWLAYVSDESGEQEVYVRPYPGPGSRVQVSQSGGLEPVWSRTTNELYYRGFRRPDAGAATPGAPLIAARYTTTPEFQVLSREALFDVSQYDAAVPHTNYDVGPDGRFVFVYQGRVSDVVLIQNWPEEVRRRQTGSR